MKRLLPILATVFVLTMFAGCDSFVEEVDLPIDTIDDSQLNDESQIPFLISGIQSRFSTSYDRVAVFAGGLSDELFFDQNVPNATFPSFREMDECDIPFANNSNDGLYNDINELRFFADNFLTRVSEITITDAGLASEAQFVGNFYGGVARYFLAAYYALSPGQPGGVITDDPDNPGPFVPASEMYAQALQRLEAARGSADAYHARVTNTLIARIHLFQGNFAEARTAAQAGLQQGDDPFTSLHISENTNYWWSQAGQGRTQWVVDWRFNTYIEEDPAEANRIKLTTIEGNDGLVTYFMQDAYPARETPLPFATWQENELMLAELDLRGGDAGSALGRANTVRGSHGLGDLGALDMDGLILERDKELFTMGMRLPDERRFGIFHACLGDWRHLPLTQSERNGNPNLGS